eukprot:5890962-Amphidinium_carterae.2
MDQVSLLLCVRSTEGLWSTNAASKLDSSRKLPATAVLSCTHASTRQGVKFGQRRKFACDGARASSLFPVLSETHGAKLLLLRLPWRAKEQPVQHVQMGWLIAAPR